LPFLARSFSLLFALLYATRSRPAIMKAFHPAPPDLIEISKFFRGNAGTSALWLATSSRMVVLRTFFGAALGPAALGLLDVAMRVPTLLVNGVSSGNQTLLVGLSAALRDNDTNRVTSLLSGLAQVLILLNVPLLFGYAAYADVMFHILVGTDVTQLTLLTWLTTAWVGVTAVNQLAFWIVQSAGLEAKQALAYALHTALFVLSVAIMLLLGAASTLNLVGSFAVTGILAESVVLWRLALSLPLFRDYVASPHFRRSLWALAISAVFGVAAALSREAEQLGLVGYIVPAGLVTVGWLASIRIVTGQWPYTHILNLNQALQSRLQRR
jgi:O-antigen/teichoic acid export membrane protein